jgi:glucosamine 6-phosphate synthetase-like amidotransferase/phosphosugar isomerase protein
LDISEKRRPRPSCWKDCGGWNIAATTARACRGAGRQLLFLRKKKGKIDEGLARLLLAEPAAGHLGIGHTRWATHGPPSDENSHPHLDQSGKIAIVHNGVIENYDALKKSCSRPGHKFRSAPTPRCWRI